jgi:hypothetical protein
VSRTSTSTDGYFKFPLLDPGTYTVEVVAPGFASYRATGVVVEVGHATGLAPVLGAAGDSAVVQVSTDQSLINADSPDLSEVVNRKAIDGIPIQNRRWSALALTTPGVVSDANGFGLVSIRGISTLLNEVQIDGADDNQAYYSEERGRTRMAYSTSANAVQEFAVNTGVYSAQYGRAAGGVINSVTRSGANQLHGELHFSDLDRGFGAFTPGALSPDGSPLKPKDLRKIYGFSAGGALIKDKLFWFYTYDQQTHVNPAIAKVRNYGSATTPNSFLNQPSATPLGTCDPSTGYLTGSLATNPNYTLDSQTCTLAARLKLGSYAAAVQFYNAGLTALQTDLGPIPRTEYQEINTPKLDWQINRNQHVSVLFHRLRWDGPHDLQTNTSNDFAIDSYGNDFDKLDYGVAKLESVLNPRMSNELLYQYGRELASESQEPYSTYTLNNLVAKGQSASGLVNGPGGTVPFVNLNESNYGTQLGSPNTSYRQAVPGESKWQVEDILYYGLGKHSLRIGADFLHNFDRIQQEPNYFGSYSYSSIANYLTDLATKGTTGGCNSTAGVGTATTSGAGAYDCYTSVFQTYGRTGFSISTMDYAGFIQDNWKVSPRLTLELGLRYDFERLPAADQSLISAVGNFVPYAGLNNLPSDKNNFGPRIGFAYDVFGRGRTVLRGGYGLYYGRIQNGNILNVRFNTGSTNGQYSIASIKPTAQGAPTFPNPVATGAAGKPSSFFFAPNLQNPQVHEFDLILQHDLGKGNVLQLSYLGALGRELPNFLDVNLTMGSTPSTITVSDSSGQGPLPNGTVLSIPTFTGYLNSNFANISELFSNINSSYNGMSVEIANRSLARLQFNVSYTWSHALDYNQAATATTITNNWINPLGSARQNYGNSLFNVPNRFVGYVIYEVPGTSNPRILRYLSNGWSLSNSFQMQSGVPYSATIGTGFNSFQALNSGTINGVPGVTYIPQIGLNTYHVPRPIVDDMRLQKSFVLRDRYRLEFNADMYNVANHQNIVPSDVTTTAYNFTNQNTSSASAPSATLVYSPRTSATAGFGSHTSSNNSGFLYTPREFQIQARLQF